MDQIDPIHLVTLEAKFSRLFFIDLIKIKEFSKNSFCIII